MESQLHQHAMGLQDMKDVVVRASVRDDHVMISS